MEIPDRPHPWTVAGAAAEVQAKRLLDKPQPETSSEEPKGWSWQWKVLGGAVVFIGVPASYVFLMGREPRLRESLTAVGLGFHVNFLRRNFPSYFYDEPLVPTLARKLDAALQAQFVAATVTLRDGTVRELRDVDPTLTEGGMLEAAGIEVTEVANVDYADTVLGDEAERLSAELHRLVSSVGTTEPWPSQRVVGRTFRGSEEAPRGDHHFYGHPELEDLRKRVRNGGNQIPYHNAPSLWLPPNGVPGMKEMREARDQELRYPQGEEAVGMAKQIRAMIGKVEAELKAGTSREIDVVQEELRLLKSELWVLKTQNWRNWRTWVQ